ncbi:MAG: LUD domain-containing protein [Nitrospinota bacterium]
MPRKGFRRRARFALADANLQEALRRATHSFDTRRAEALATLEDSEALRRRASEIRTSTLNHVDQHLTRLAERVQAAGGEVHFCDDAEAVWWTVLRIAERRGKPPIIKSKSMATEEVHLNTALEAAGLTPVETDLGEWILQLAGEPPSHLIAPAIHKTTEEIADLFNRRFAKSLPPSENEALTALARRELREAFLSAGIGITGVNFAVAETGTVVLVTNEGNGRMVTSLPPVHIAVMGLEKVVPTLEGVCLLLKLLARCGTGQKMTAYVTFVTGVRRRADGAEGPEEFHLIVLDGGRSAHLAGPFQEALTCIKCGACLNACPVYRKVGGHAYDSTYPGPIGSILSPMLWGLDLSGDLPYASSLCGACLDACPVQVDIPRMLLQMRASATRKKETPWLERTVFRAGGFLLRHPWAYRTAGWSVSKLQRPFLRGGAITRLPWPFSRWTRMRVFPPVASRSFQSRWKKLQWEEFAAPPHRDADDPSGERNGRTAGMIRRAARSLRTGVPHAGALRVKPAEPPQGSKAERFCRELEGASGRAYRVRDLRDASRIVSDLFREGGFSRIASWDTPLLRILEGAISTELAELTWLWGAGRERDFEALKTAEAGITEVDFALASLGTLGLIARPGRSRLVSLLPAVHVALLPAGRLTEGLEDLPVVLREAFGPESERSGVQGIDLITGPSRSSDIGMVPTLGAHGPKEVHVIVLEGPEEGEPGGTARSPVARAP